MLMTLLINLSLLKTLVLNLLLLLTHTNLIHAFGQSDGDHADVFIDSTTTTTNFLTTINTFGHLVYDIIDFF